MAVSFNAIENTIYWECQNCGCTMNKGTVSEFNDYYVKCEECGTLHDVEVNIDVKLK